VPTIIAPSLTGRTHNHCNSARIDSNWDRNPGAVPTLIAPEDGQEKRPVLCPLIGVIQPPMIAVRYT
jgi:hypothetical protein